MNGIFGISNAPLTIKNNFIGVNNSMPSSSLHIVGESNGKDWGAGVVDLTYGIRLSAPRYNANTGVGNRSAPLIFEAYNAANQTVSRLLHIMSGTNYLVYFSTSDPVTKTVMTNNTMMSMSTTLQAVGIYNLGVATQLQALGGLGSTAVTYKIDNASGTTFTPKILFGASGSASGQLRIGYEETSNQFVFLAGNSGAVNIARAAIQITSLTNTAGAETADLSFLTKANGATILEKLRIGSNGTLSGTGQARFGITSGSSTIIDLYTTNGGGAITTGLLLVGRGLTFSAGIQTLQYEDTTNRLHFAASNGTRHISRASIGIDGLGNSAGSEYASLCFYTKDTGSAEAERWRISYNGCFNNLASNVNAHIGLAGSTTSNGLFFFNGDCVLMTTPTAGTVDCDNTFTYFTNASAKRLKMPLVEDVVVLADVTATSTTTLANANYLVVNLIGGYSYRFSAKVFVRASAGGFKLLVTGTATTDEYVESVKIFNSTGVDLSDTTNTLGSNTVQKAGGDDYLVEVEGYITASNSGTLRIQFAQETSDASPSSIMTGSNLSIEQTS